MCEIAYDLFNKSNPKSDKVLTTETYRKIKQRNTQTSQRGTNWLEYIAQALRFDSSDYKKYLTDAGLKVYQPKNKHLYNTLLIEVETCPLEIISELADDGIYIGNVSSCENEDIYEKKGQDDNSYKAIRLSFESDTNISDEVLNRIVECLKRTE